MTEQVTTTNNVKNVMVGKPKLTGGIYMAPAGTVLPTDASTALSDEYKGLGYISEDGVTLSTDRSTESIIAWGGDNVLEATTGVEYGFGFTLIESIREEVLKLVYGEENVTVSNGKFDVYAGSGELEEHVFVVETIDSQKNPIRYIIPRGKLTENGDLSLNNSDAAGYEVTIKALPYFNDDYKGKAFRITNN